MNKVIQILLFSAIGFFIGFFCLGGLLPFIQSYSFFISFIGILISFIYIFNSKNYKNIISYTIFLSIGSFFGIDFVIPDALSKFLNISTEYSYFIGFIVGIFKLYFIYLLILMKYFCIDNENFISNRLNKLSLDVKIVLYSITITFVQILTEYVFPGQVGYILNEHVEYLNLLPIVGLSGYTYLLTFVFIGLSLIIKERKISCFYILFIICSLVINFTLQIDYNLNYNKKESLNVRIIQYPFLELKQFDTFPDKFIKEEFSPIIEESKNVDLILFPEASFPYVYKDYKDFSNLLFIKNAIKNKANVQLSLFKEMNNKIYNVSILVKKNRLPSFYYKEQLFPVGETSPLFLNLLINKDKKEDMNTKENKERLFKIKEFSYLPLLCFENFNPNLFRKSNKIWSFVTIQSNESWVFNSNMRKYLLNFSKIRAKEFNTYIYKSDTSGPSSIINNKGETIVNIINNKEFFDYSSPKKISNKFEYYYKYREFVLLLIVIFQLSLILVVELIRIKDK